MPRSVSFPDKRRTGYPLAVHEIALPEWLTPHNVRRFLLAVIILNISIPIGIHLGYRDDMGDLGALGGFNLTPATLALGTLYLPFLVKKWGRAADPALQLSRLSIPWALYLLFCVLSLFEAKDVTLGLYEVSLLFQVFLLHFYIVNSHTRREDVLLIIRCLLIGLAAEGLLMIALAGGLGKLGNEIQLDDESAADVTRQLKILSLRARIDENSTTGRSRVAGALGSPNDAAGYICGVTGVASSVLLTSLRRRDKVLASVAASLGVISVILTFSRGGLVSLTLILSIISFFALRNRQISWKVPVAVVACALIGALFFSDTIAYRLKEDDKGAARSRVPLMKLATLMIEDHPLVGVGANNFPLAMEPYVRPSFSGEFLYTVHNKYLLVWSETGPGALVAFVWFLVDIVRRGMRCWRYRDPLASPLALGCAAAITGQMVHMLVDIFRGHPAMQFICVISAVQVLLERIAQQPATASANRYSNARRLRFI